MRISIFVAGTAAVLVAAAALAQYATGSGSIVGSAAPDFTATGTDGKTYSLAGVEKKAPMIMVFWKNPCPHNPKASGQVNSILEAYKGKVNFVGVVNATGDSAKTFQDRFGKEYPFLQDPEKKIIGAYKQPKSIVFIVIDKDKRIEAVIPGYGQDSMAKLNTAMAKAAGAAEAKLDFSGAPTGTVYG